MIEADNLPIGLGAQNVFWEDKGAYTGEVSPSMLAKLGVSYVIVGHSERREIFGETDEMVNKKVKAVFKARDDPDHVRAARRWRSGRRGRPRPRCPARSRPASTGSTPKQVGAMVIAYEPIWAIGTGRNATPEDANETIGTIRSMVAGLAGEAPAAAIRIQYGGSVKPGNIAAIMAQPEIDGALVGGASLEADDFAQIVRWA